MKARSYLEDERELIRLANRQGGYFTAKQAAALGYSAPKRSYHVRNRNWEREHRGVFRLAAHPLVARPDLMRWWLWSRNRNDEPQGIYSHQTALTLHELTDAMPSRVHMTVPPGFRRSAAIPRPLVLHVAVVEPRDVEIVEGVPVTRALRTLLDMARSGDVAMEELQYAFRQAVRSGKITRMEIAEAAADPARRELLRGLRVRGS